MRNFAEIAAQLHDPDNGIFGTCQRGKAGWGENMAFVGPMVNAFGGQWFDMDWNPTIDSPEWHAAITYYVDLMNNYGPPGASANGHNENRALFADGRCATWVDATSAAGYIYNPDESSVADTTGFFQAPMQVTDKGTGWFWAWALAIPTSSQNVRCGQGIPGLVDLGRLRDAGGRDQGLGRRASGHPAIDL